MTSPDRNSANIAKFEKIFGREITNIEIKDDVPYRSMNGHKFYKKNYHVYFKKGRFQFLNIFNEPDEIISENWVILPDGSHEFCGQPNPILTAIEEEKRNKEHNVIKVLVVGGPIPALLYGLLTYKNDEKN